MIHKKLKGRERIPVLMYHDVFGGEPLPHKYTVPSENFSQQMAYIKKQSIRTLSLNDFPENCSHHESELPAILKNVVLTFDDGHSSNYSYVLPLLLEMGLTASFFITTAHIDQKVDFVTRKQIRRMSENGMSIGSHTHNHKFLDELSPGEIFEELRQSKTCLEDIIGREISFLSCPGGRYNSAVIDIAANIGYRGVFTSVPTSKIFDDAILVSGRFLIDSTVQLHTFIQIVNLHTMYIAKERLEYTLKSAIKKTIGNSAYHKVWRKISTSSEP